MNNLARGSLAVTGKLQSYEIASYYLSLTCNYFDTCTTQAVKTILPNATPIVVYLLLAYAVN